jgi:hypothetical protein
VRMQTSVQEVRRLRIIGWRKLSECLKLSEWRKLSELTELDVVQPPLPTSNSVMGNSTNDKCNNVLELGTNFDGPKAKVERKPDLCPHCAAPRDKLTRESAANSPRRCNFRPTFLDQVLGGE